MAKTDWGLNDVVQPSDLNGIGQEINQLREDVDNMDFPLSDATDGTRSDVAASEKAVGLVMQEAQAAKQAGNERKADVVAALVAKGISASTSESWDSLIAKMAAIIKATGNATAAQVRAGVTFSNATANGLTGTLPVRATGPQTITPGASDIIKDAGIYDGAITIKGVSIANPGIFRENRNITKGTYSDFIVPSSGNAWSFFQVTTPSNNIILACIGSSLSDVYIINNDNTLDIAIISKNVIRVTNKNPVNNYSANVVATFY